MRLPRTLLAARQALDAGSLSAVELLAGLHQVLEEQEPTVHAMVTATHDLAREQALKADARLVAGDRTPMLGIPVVLKDLLDVAGVPTRAGSKVLENNVPATSSTVWSRLEAAGAVLVGKANTHEFAYGGTTAPTRNPADTSRIVGGSSGGPAAALAAGYCLGAIGTDTAGSIRIPANLCGVAGLKPTRGTLPAEGIVPLSPTLDAVGPMARSVADLAPLLQVLCGTDPQPPTNAPMPRKVGVLRHPGRQADSVGRGVAATEEALQSLGIPIVEVELDGFDQSLLDNFTVIGFEASRYHAQWADRRDLYTPYVRERLAAAAEVTEEHCRTALAGAAALTAALDRVLEEVDVILLPGVPFPAPPAYDEQVLVAGSWEDRDSGLCRNTAFANLTGHPALAMPAGLDDGLPVGIQLVGRPHTDLGLVALGARLEPMLPPGLPPHLRTE